MDHGLRPESAQEAASTVEILRIQGIEAVQLRWNGPYPTANLQAEARAERYRLLEAWCAEAGVLHLLIGQHRDDQAETLLQRLDRGSGIDGLSGVAAVSYRGFGRLLRPLLDYPKADLIATCRAQGLRWADDPGNRSARFGRSRLRAALADSLGAPPARLAARLAAAARHAARARSALEQATADVLARCLRMDPAGYARLYTTPLRAAPEEIQLRALNAAVAGVAGTGHPPRLDRLERLAHALFDDAPAGRNPPARTFGGCRWTQTAPDRWLILREPAAIGPDLPLDGEVRWDDRFLLSGGGPGLFVTAFGPARQAEARARGWVPDRLAGPPRAVWSSLPAICDLDGVAAVPHLLYCRNMEDAGKLAKIAILFHPRQPFANAGGHGLGFSASAAARKSFR